MVPKQENQETVTKILSDLKVVSILAKFQAILIMGSQEIARKPSICPVCIYHVCAAFLFN